MSRAAWPLFAAMGLAGGLASLFWAGIDHATTTPTLAVLVLVLFTVNALALAAAGVTAVMGLRGPQPRPAQSDPPQDRCAILWLLCGEPPEPLAERANMLDRRLRLRPEGERTQIFILSDTTDPVAVDTERTLFGAMSGVTYRNRTAPQGRKPGNLRDWLAQYGGQFDTMLVLDSDSGFCARKLARMRRIMAHDPALGLLQAGIGLRPGTSRLARLQRLSARLTGPVFTHGLARLSGACANYWGHNALLRVDAYRSVAALPDLPGPAPFGGPVLSHDFIEAANLRAAGWDIRILPDTRGSFEDAPETTATHTRRDRRWAQGNLQHLRLIGGRGLHMGSRLHLLAGIHSYLSAPVWLALVVLLGSGAVHARLEAVIALAATLALLLVPKLAGLVRLRAHLARKSGLLLRAYAAELAVSTVIAPIWMLQRSGHVASVLAGRDTGWHPSGSRGADTRHRGRGAQLAGLVILLAVMVPQAWLASGASAALSGAMVLPVVCPLMLAPWLLAWLDAPARPNRVAAYYDASTRRFLAVGGSGAALAIHRPLWADGITTSEQAAGHVNTLIGQAAMQAMGHTPRHVFDLGCGVGGTVFHLAQLWPQTRFSGLTLSGEQIRLARAYAEGHGLADRCHFLQADFTRQPNLLTKADFAIAVESHVHAPSAKAFLQAALAHLAPGGVLVLVDDMLSDTCRLAPPDARLIDSFRKGWRLGHVTPCDSIVAQAEGLGYATVAQTDLSQHLHLTRLRDRALRVVGPVVEWLGLDRHALFANMVGGNALTESYRRGLMRYTMLVLRAPEAVPLPRGIADTAA